MAQETTQAQAPTPAEPPAVPASAAQPAQGRADRKNAVVDLTDAELQVVSGGGSKPGQVGDGRGC